MKSKSPVIDQPVMKPYTRESLGVCAAFAQHCEILIAQAEAQGLSAKALKLLATARDRAIKTLGKKARSKMKLATALGELRGAIMDSHDVKKELHERPAGEANWGEETFRYIEAFWR